MRQLLSQLVRTIGRGFTFLSILIYQKPQAKRIKLWYKDSGDKTLRLNYELDANSVVFDLGGYEGQWASDIFAKYCCNIHIFEPVSEFIERIEQRFNKNKKIVVYRFGLADKTANAELSVAADGSSIFRKSGTKTEQIQLIKAIDFMRDHHIQKIDLMKINIEGGEYELLEHLLDTGFVKNIKNIQVQFHDFIPDAEQRMLAIQQKLNQTHCLTYQYPFVWENWQLRDMQE